MTFARTLAAAAAAVTLAVAPLAPALAQQSDAAPEAPADVSDAKLDSFVVAALSVSEIAQEFEGRMQAAADDAARQSLANEAREAMIGAVEETDGITVEEYVTISEAARSDADLNQRVMDMLAERAEAE
ncbi:MAG: DUF4168 domain-containing protein [Paracoccaceae bacterium]|jgi:hypothetical protein|nr:DUF4168 domain-containing protein [Paracoccaceae bacterium]